MKKTGKNRKIILLFMTAFLAVLFSFSLSGCDRGSDETLTFKAKVIDVAYKTSNSAYPVTSGNTTVWVPTSHDYPYVRFQILDPNVRFAGNDWFDAIGSQVSNACATNVGKECMITVTVDGDVRLIDWYVPDDIETDENGHIPVNKNKTSENSNENSSGNAGNEVSNENENKTDNSSGSESKNGNTAQNCNEESKVVITETTNTSGGFTGRDVNDEGSGKF